MNGRIVVIGCGNGLRRDDGVGPAVIHRLRCDGVPDGVDLVDSGTDGIAVAFRMRGAAHAVVVDGAVTGSPPGTIHRVPAAQIEELAEPAALSSHALRWDHSLAVARWLLGDEHPDRVSVFLVELADTRHGTDLSEPVADAAREVAHGIRSLFPATEGSAGRPSGGPALQLEPGVGER